MSRGRPALLALGVVVAAVLLGSAGLRSGASPGPADRATPETAPSSSAGGSGDAGPRTIEVEPSRAARVGSVAAMGPREIRLPGTAWLDVAAVGTRANGVLDVPGDVEQIGWWEGGSRIGDPFGSVLLAGHVDSRTQGRGPSAVLLDAPRGAQVAVRTAARTTRWEIVSRTLVPRDDLAEYPRVLSARGPARLTLVTCAPPFIASRGGYQNLAVVEARPLDGPGRTPTR